MPKIYLKSEIYAAPVSQIGRLPIAALKGHDELASQARQLLERYAPDGPGAGATAADWQSWWRENKPYSFFSDSGGYRWYIDPLAKSRSVPTMGLRGPARADAPRANDRPRAEP